MKTMRADAEIVRLMRLLLTLHNTHAFLLAVSKQISILGRLFIFHYVC